MTYQSKKLAVQQQEEEVLFAISFLKAYLLALITGAYFTDEWSGYRRSLLDKRIAQVAIAKSFVFPNARQEAFAFRFAFKFRLAQPMGRKTLRNCVSSKPIASREKEKKKKERETRFFFSSPFFLSKEVLADWNRRMILALPNFRVRPLPLNFSFSLEIRGDGYQKRHWRSPRFVRICLFLEALTMAPRATATLDFRPRLLENLSPCIIPRSCRG